MRLALPLAAALLLAGCDVAGRLQPSGETEEQADDSSRAAIEAALDDSAAGWNEGDIERFMAVYSETPETSFVTAEGLLRGREAMAERYQQNYDFTDVAARGELSMETLDVRPLGDNHALYVGRYILSYPQGEPASGITTLVFAREDDGWRIIADHSS